MGIIDPLSGPDFDQIALGNDRATSDATFYLTKKLEEEALIRARDDRRIAAAASAELWGVLADPQSTVGGPTEQTTTATGTQNDFDLTGAFTFLRCNNASALTLTGFTVDGLTPAAGNRVLIHNIGTSTVKVAHQTGSTAANRAITVSTNGQSLGAGGWIWGIYDGTTARWRVVLLDHGAPIDVAYAAGNFTGSGTITWTVAEADVTQFQYVQRGRVLELYIFLENTTVSGTGIALLIAVPDGFNVSFGNLEVAAHVEDNGTDTTGFFRAQDAQMQFLLVDVTNWAASTNATDVSISTSVTVD